MIGEIHQGCIWEYRPKVINRLRAQIVTYQKNLVMPVHRAANPDIKILCDNRHALQHGRPHPNYLIRNPCFTEGGKEL